MAQHGNTLNKCFHVSLLQGSMVHYSVAILIAPFVQDRINSPTNIGASNLINKGVA